jgi:hypothetical protein
MADQGSMNRVAGRVVVSETGAGAPGLLVSLHAIASASDAIQSADSAAVKASARKKRPAFTVRLGSTVTDSRGAFELTFADADYGNSVRGGPGTRPNLGLVVQAPEAPGMDDNVRVLVASKVIPQAARQETFSLRVPASALTKAGLQTEGVAKVPPGQRVLTEYLADIKRVLAAAPDHVKPPPSRTPVEVRPEANGAGAVVGDPKQPAVPSPFRAGIGAVAIEAAPGLPALDGKLTFDAANRQFLYKPPEQDAFPLVFAGSRYAVSDDATLSRVDGIRLVIDIGKRQFELVLPRSAPSLRAAEPPSRLAAWYQGGADGKRP